MWTMSVPMFRGNGKGRGFILGVMVVGWGCLGSCCEGEVVGRRFAAEVLDASRLAVKLFEIELGTSTWS